jgi:hypothetical protein
VLEALAPARVEEAPAKFVLGLLVRVVLIRFADARGRMKGAMIRGVARDADLLALVPVSLF